MGESNNKRRRMENVMNPRNKMMCFPAAPAKPRCDRLHIVHSEIQDNSKWIDINGEKQQKAADWMKMCGGAGGEIIAISLRSEFYRVFCVGVCVCVEASTLDRAYVQCRLQTVNRMSECRTRTINDENDGIKKNTNDFFSAFELMQFFVRHLSLNDSIYSVEIVWLIVGYVVL